MAWHQRRLPAYPERPCVECGAPFQPWKIDARFCTPLCMHRWHGRRKHDLQRGGAYLRTGACAICGTAFRRDSRYDWRRRYCSPPCAKEGQRLSRQRFHERNPLYRRREHARVAQEQGWSNTVTRFFKRCPDVPRRCQVCGEAQVVDIHHRVRRHGAPVRAANTQQEDVWVLCPNHHAMLHRGVTTPEALGLT